MVEIASTESIRGIGAGRPSYADNIVKSGLPLLRGGKSHYFDSSVIETVPGSVNTIFLDKVPDDKSIQVKGAFIDILSNSLVKIIINRKILTADGNIIEETYSKQGYGSVTIKNIVLELQGNERSEIISGYGTTRIIDEQIGADIITLSNRRVDGVFGVWGVEKPI